MENTKTKGKKLLMIGLALLATFIVWTILIQTVDVQPIGQNGTDIGFATFNCWFHAWTGVHMTIYTITDWLGLVPLLVCLIFGGIGLVQFVKRKSLFKVDADIIILGVYYVVVIFAYVFFEMIPINYRPIRINGFMEASYPSSTTLLVLSVMLSLMEQVHRRVKHTAIRNGICVVAVIFSAYMVIGRTISGVHWFTDIVGSVILSAGLFAIYQSVVWLCNKEV
ncbi:MAG: phosphatase PAP2 family protein [bacterium]|nr:phosphatase PAP2 family protein [bacterium]